MGLDRRAVFFSITALLIVGVLFVTLSQTVTTESTGTRIVQLRDIVRDMNSLETSILPSVLRAHGVQVLREMAFAAVDGESLNSGPDAVASEFSACFVGDCNFPNTITPLDDKLRDVEQAYREHKQYDNVSIKVHQVTLNQLGPFTLGATAVVEYRMVDSVEQAVIQKTESITVRIPIEGLPDPLATQTYGGGTVQVVKRPPTNLAVPNVTDQTYTVSTHPDTNRTLEFAINGYYLPDTNAPGYLERLSLRKTANEVYGIHTIRLQPSGQNSVDFLAAEDNICFYVLQHPNDLAFVNLPARQASLYQLITEPVTLGLVTRSSECTSADGGTIESPNI